MPEQTTLDPDTQGVNEDAASKAMGEALDELVKKTEESNITQMPEQSQPQTQSQEPSEKELPKTPEDAFKQFGKLTEAKQELATKIIDTIIHGCSGNAILVAEMAEHISGLVLEQCLKGKLGLTATQYARFITGNHNLRIGLISSCLEDELSKSQNMLGQASQKMAEMEEMMRSLQDENESMSRSAQAVMDSQKEAKTN